jgi:hypothetical protein
LTKTEKLAKLRKDTLELEQKIKGEETIKGSLPKIQKYVEGLSIDWEEFVRLAYEALPKQPKVTYSDADRLKWVQLSAQKKKPGAIAKELHNGQGTQTIASYLRKLRKDAESAKAA